MRAVGESLDEWDYERVVKMVCVLGFREGRMVLSSAGQWEWVGVRVQPRRKMTYYFTMREERLCGDAIHYAQSSTTSRREKPEGGFFKTN